MKKQLALPIFITLVILFTVLSCDTGLTNTGNNDLIGYWRSEKTYQNTFESTKENFYDIFIFEQNRVIHFGSTDWESIKYDNYDDPFFADWWNSYTIDDGKIYITSVNSYDGNQYRTIIPFRFSGGNLILTLPAFEAEYMGLTDRNVRYIRL